MAQHLMHGYAVRETTDVEARGDKAMIGTYLSFDVCHGLCLVQWSNGVRSYHKAERLVRA